MPSIVSEHAWPAEKVARIAGSLGECYDSNSFREAGNRMFFEKKFNDAIRAYERAIALDPRCPLAASNASEAALQLCDFKRALDFALCAREIDASHKKSWFRYVKSLWSRLRCRGLRFHCRLCEKQIVGNGRSSKPV